MTKKRVERKGSLKDEMMKKKEGKEKKFIYCPLCKKFAHEDDYIHNSFMKTYVHEECGVVFMNPEHVKQIQAEMKREKEKKIIVPKS